jgi:uncharacterized protein (TIGR02001 family)
MKNALRSVWLVAGLIGMRVAEAGIALEDFGGSLALTSDDVFHGISQTCGDPAVQGGLDYRSSGGLAATEVFAGVWASAGLGRSVCGKARELNFYAGYNFAPGPDSSASLTYTHYGYPGGAYTLRRLAGFRYDYDSVGVRWSWRDEVSVTVDWTPNALRYTEYSVARDRTALSYGVQLHHPLPGGFSLSGGVGYDQVTDPFNVGYAFWNAGVGYAWRAVQLQVGYFGTANRADRLFGSYVAGNRASVSAVWRLP